MIWARFPSRSKTSICQAPLAWLATTWSPRSVERRPRSNGLLRARSPTQALGDGSSGPTLRGSASPTPNRRSVCVSVQPEGPRTWWTPRASARPLGATCQEPGVKAFVSPSEPRPAKLSLETSSPPGSQRLMRRLPGSHARTEPSAPTAIDGAALNSSGPCPARPIRPSNSPVSPSNTLNDRSCRSTIARSPSGITCADTMSVNAASSSSASTSVGPATRSGADREPGSQ